MNFYDCSTAPSPRRVRIFMAEKDIEIPTLQVDLASGEQFSESFRRLNPYCTVPVLELDDGTTLCEVLAICQYLEEDRPDPPLFGRDKTERAVVTMWNARVEQNGLAAVAECFRNQAKGLKGRALPGALDLDQIPELVARGSKRVEFFMGELDKQLAGHQFIVGDYFSIADISAFVAIEFAGRIKLPIVQRASNLKRWHERIATRPSASA